MTSRRRNGSTHIIASSAFCPQVAADTSGRRAPPEVLPAAVASITLHFALPAACILLPRAVGSTREGGGFDHRFPSRFSFNDGSPCGTEVSKCRLHARRDRNRDGRPRDAASFGHGIRAPKLLSVPRSGYANRFGHPSNARTFAAALAPVTRRSGSILPGQW